MFELYAAKTPNGRKPLIALEEMGLPYTLHLLNLSEGEQFSPEFTALNPNQKIPVLVDTQAGETIIESGAILLYLAEITGQFIPSNRHGRLQVWQWLMFQMGNIGPMFGQLGHFRHAAPENIPYGIERYEKEVKRLLGVLEIKLSQQTYIAGDYSIADMATYPWVKISPYLGVPLEAYPHVQTWVETVSGRSAVQKAMAQL